MSISSKNHNAPSVGNLDAERERADRDALLAEYDAMNAIARATPCNFDECTRLGHEGGVVSSDWSHDREHVFRDGPISVVIARDAAGRGSATLMTDRVDPLLTAVELRSMAEQYESFPAWLRDRADELDALSA